MHFQCRGVLIWHVHILKTHMYIVYHLQDLRVQNNMQKFVILALKHISILFFSLVQK